MNYKQWHKDCISLSEKGLSGRKIAKQLGMPKSTVNDMLKEYREGTLELLEPEKKEVRYLYWDLENSFMQGYFFDIWQVNIPISQVTKHSHLLTAAWAVNDDEPQGIRITPEDVKTGNDLEVVKIGRAHV